MCQGVQRYGFPSLLTQDLRGSGYGVRVWMGAGVLACGFAPQAGAKARRFGLLTGSEEPNVPSRRMATRTSRTAVDTGRLHSVDKLAFCARVPREHLLPGGFGVEFGGSLHQDLRYYTHGGHATIFARIRPGGTPSRARKNISQHCLTDSMPLMLECTVLKLTRYFCVPVWHRLQ